MNLVTASIWQLHMAIDILHNDLFFAVVEHSYLCKLQLSFSLYSIYAILIFVIHLKIPASLYVHLFVCVRLCACAFESALIPDDCMDQSLQFSWQDHGSGMPLPTS